MKYNRSQWLDSFEDQLSFLRPHLPRRVLSAMSMQAWMEHGTKDVDPIKAAKAESAALDEAK